MIDRLELRHPLIRRIAEGKPKDHPLVGVAPGTGLITKTAALAGADVIFALSAGVYRMAGVGSLASFLAYGNANDQTEQLLQRQILSHAGSTPVVAGLMPNDPKRTTADRLDRLRALGVEAVTNWPATGLVDGTLRAIMTAEGLTHASECAMLAEAKERGFAVFGFALNAPEVERFCALGVDGLILNVGLTREAEGAVEKRDQIGDAVLAAKEMWRAVGGSPPLSFLFGGSILQPLDLEEILREVPIHGYAGGSAFERIPVEAIVDSTVRRLKAVPRPGDESGIPTSRRELVGESRRMRELYGLMDRVAPYNVNVLIQGETGTGKELVARYLHRESPRRQMPFVTMNCGAIPGSLVESEFFGHEKGAFTGAQQRRMGKFELANHGMLFLDEIGDLSSHGQVALLRVIQQGEIFRIGGQRPVRVDVRIIAATNRNLEEEVHLGRFRSDLYFRINSMVILTPSLRSRPSDIPLLIRHHLRLLSLRLNRRIIGVTDRFLKRLSAYAWPGNVRELEHVLTRAALLEDGAILEGKNSVLGVFAGAKMGAGDVSGRINGEAGDSHTASGTGMPSKAERARAAVSRCSHNKSRAALELGISRKTLYQWLGSPD